MGLLGDLPDMNKKPQQYGQFNDNAHDKTNDYNFDDFDDIEGSGKSR
jgi:hypothetical protein